MKDCGFKFQVRSEGDVLSWYFGAGVLLLLDLKLVEWFWRFEVMVAVFRTLGSDWEFCEARAGRLIEGIELWWKSWCWSFEEV